MLRRRLMMRLQGGFRWISSRKWLRMSSRAVGDAALGVDAASGKQMSIHREATGEARPVAALTQGRKTVMARDNAPGTAPAIGAAVGRQMRMWMTALDAYKVALLQLGRKMGLLRKTEATSAPGVDAGAVRSVSVERESDAESAPGMDAAMKRDMVMERSPDVEAADITAADLAKDMLFERDFVAKAAPGQDGAAQHHMVMCNTISGATWIDPVLLDGGVLYIRQAYAATLNGNTLEVS